MNNITKVLQQGENEKVEFKTTFGKSVIETLVAFANSKGGTVYVGVKDDGTVVGVELEKESLQKWTNEIKQKTEPSLSPEIKQYKVNKKEVLMFYTPEYPVKPIAFQGRYFNRVQNSNHLLSADKIATLRLECLNQSFDAIPTNIAFENLDTKALQVFQNKVENRGRFTSTGNLQNDFVKLGFYNNKRMLWAAELLFGLHHTNIHIGRFKSETTIIDDTIIRSPLVVAVDEAMDFVKRNIRLAYEFTGELQRKEVWQYPLPVIRELLLNAVVHRDYRASTDVIIKIFDDYIDFSNPGGLFGNLSVADIEAGFYQPTHRNKLLAEAFYLMGEVEKYGTGFGRIKEWLLDYPNIKIKIIQTDNFFRLHLILNKDSIKDVVKDVVKDVAKDVVKERETFILRIVAKDKDISAQKMSELLNVTLRTIQRDLKKLQEKGILKRIGGRKTGYWKIVKDEK